MAWFIIRRSRGSATSVTRIATMKQGMAAQEDSTSAEQADTQSNLADQGAFDAVLANRGAAVSGIGMNARTRRRSWPRSHPQQA
jgi:hypothetical protein